MGCIIDRDHFLSVIILFSGRDKTAKRYLSNINCAVRSKAVSLKLLMNFSTPDALFHSYYQIITIYTGNMKVQTVLLTKKI